MTALTQDNRGITLIEVLLSVTLLSVGILGLLQAFPRATEAQYALEREVIANHLAQEKLESFMQLAYEDVALGTLENNVAVEPDPQSPFHPFMRTTTVQYVDENLSPSGSDAGLKRITVVISWAHPGGTGQVSLTTLRSK
ncbi:MAG: prepilin-type N-terminal cleavage/methylation domain-containing protein [Patescibacteria group bacterium]|nr:prepilin-type N-terminal cleavage/methylation domain-containing protein [bacterium]MDZ4221475.1 prepilin-type N-terminal cleavage/methylation domain-containing protein [Patescibacteria group bacterium]